MSEPASPEAAEPPEVMTFGARVRVAMPPRKAPDLQSLYVFSMYRAGSSVTEAICESLCRGSAHAAFPVVKALEAAGVALIDHGDLARSSAFVDDAGMALDQIGHHGGYLYYGFRELPPRYASRFMFPAAAVVVVRDPRDVLISQYRAVQKHTLEGASGANVAALRDITARQGLEEFATSPGSIAFMQRVVGSYRPLIGRGVQVLQYESFMSRGAFDAAGLTEAIVDVLAPYLRLEWTMEAILDNLARRIANSPDLRGHAATGGLGLHRRLGDEAQARLAEALGPELALLGYD